MQQRRQVLLDEWCSTALPTRYRDLNLQMRRREPPELALSRRLLHGLYAARSGHGDFATYHRRFNHHDANLECRCGQEKSPTHFVRCSFHTHEVRKFRKGSSMNYFTSQLLGPHCLEKFEKFAQVAGCFGIFSAH